MKNNHVSKFVLILSVVALGVTACSTEEGSATKSKNGPVIGKSLQEIETLAKKEGKVVSVGMPDNWANWKQTWGDITSKYEITHTDTDMSSAEEIAKFDAEKKKPTADIGDVGISYGTIAVKKGVTLPYKTSYWNDIPDWAKDKDGNWMVDYQGTIAVITDKNQVKNPPKTWADLLNGTYKVGITDVSKSAQAQSAVLAAAIAYGGNEGNIQPGLDFFAKLAKQGRLAPTDGSVTSLEKGEVPVELLWDFTALGYRDQIDPNRFDVSILKEGSVVSGYTTIINKYAPDPNAAMMAREFILSDQGQINLARGYARPIRTNVKLPDDVAKKLLPSDEYKNAKPIKDYTVWGETSKKLPELWQEQVLSNIN